MTEAWLSRVRSETAFLCRIDRPPSLEIPPVRYFLAFCRRAMDPSPGSDINWLQPCRSYTMWLVLNWAGLRRAELAALRTHDVDLKVGIVQVEGLVAGTAEPATLAQLARGRMRTKIPQLERAFAGRFAAHQRFIVGQQLAHIDYLDEVIERLSAEVAERVAPFGRGN